MNDISVARGSILRHHSEEQLRLKVGDEDMQISLRVTDAAHTIHSVDTVNEAGAAVEFPSIGRRGSPLITRGSERRQTRLGWRRWPKVELRMELARMDW